MAIPTAERESQDVEAWLRRAAGAPTREARLLSLSIALELDPQHPVAQLAMYEALGRQLEADAFLAYVNETDWIYRVHTASRTPVVVPKMRAVPRPYPVPEPGPLHSASRWLRLAILGLLPSGLGTLLFAPMALFAALRVPAPTLSRKDQKRRRIFVAASSLLWAVGLLLGVLVLVHV